MDITTTAKTMNCFFESSIKQLLSIDSQFGTLIAKKNRK